MFDRAVVNSGPLVALSLLGQLDLLPALYAECWVPQTVFDEVAGVGKPGAKSLLSADWQGRSTRTCGIPRSVAIRLMEDTAQECQPFAQSGIVNAVV